MALIRCDNCKGTGRVSVVDPKASLDTLYWANVPIGVVVCPVCNGTGKTYFPDEAAEKLKQMLEFAGKAMKGEAL